LARRSLRGEARPLQGDGQAAGGLQWLLPQPARVPPLIVEAGQAKGSDSVPLTAARRFLSLSDHTPTVVVETKALAEAVGGSALEETIRMRLAADLPPPTSPETAMKVTQIAQEYAYVAAAVCGCGRRGAIRVEWQALLKGPQDPLDRLNRDSVTGTAVAP